ncbi:MAG: hypothetical protein A2096_06340 [Spirochaetes bacterium GWF1_41_5]|nr:MAG: hypothetical protein A2096_06340 [Spirochaetes bacterium GWF1_41_5]
MPAIDFSRYKAGNALEFSGRQKFIYRALEIFPGLLSWSTLAVCVAACFIAPMQISIFIIAFDVYWLLKTLYLSIHLWNNWKKMEKNLKTDWKLKLAGRDYTEIWHLVILPFYNESGQIIEKSLKALAEADYDTKKLAVVLAAEEKAGKNAEELASGLCKKYKKHFGYFLVSIHPENLPGEQPGKGANTSWACSLARKKIIEKNHLPEKNIIVSVFDIDTVIYPQYFLCLSWNYLEQKNPELAAYQPVPVFNNNIWEASAVSRLMAYSCTFWHMIQQETVNRLTTFSSHAHSLTALKKSGFWQKNIVSEDSRIYWNCFFASRGNYYTVPMVYPVSMDANAGKTWLETIINIYKQQRRWCWGVENIPYLAFGFLFNKEIPFFKKIYVFITQLFDFWSLATNPLIIFILGWMPVLFGGTQFNTTVLSYNLPIVTRNLMIITMLSLSVCAAISVRLMPELPERMKKTRFFHVIMQWVLIPVTINFFSALPALDAQTRLMFGRYMNFWVTPKHRRKN